MLYTRLLVGGNPHIPVFAIALSVSYATRCLALLRNVTVDDEFGDELTGALPVYLPDDGWAQGLTCGNCDADPDPLSAFDDTWHEAVVSSNRPLQKTIQVNFTGVAVYAFFILANDFRFTTITQLAFDIDGVASAGFEHTPTSEPTYEYNVLAYSNENLSNVAHQITISTAGNQANLVLFDYIIYTFEDDKADHASSSTTRSTAAPAPASTSTSVFSSQISSLPSSSFSFTLTDRTTSLTSSGTSISIMNSTSSHTTGAPASSTSAAPAATSTIADALDKESARKPIALICGVISGTIFLLVVAALAWRVCLRKRFIRGERRITPYRMVEPYTPTSKSDLVLEKESPPTVTPRRKLDWFRLISFDKRCAAPVSPSSSVRVTLFTYPSLLKKMNTFRRASRKKSKSESPPQYEPRRAAYSS